MGHCNNHGSLLWANYLFHYWKKTKNTACLIHGTGRGRLFPALLSVSFLDFFLYSQDVPTEHKQDSIAVLTVQDLRPGTDVV
jgi:hypothetical protein